MKAIAEFKRIYLTRFGIDLSDDEANQKGLELLELFQYIYRRIPTEDAQKLILFDSEYRAS